ncbi:unnamed protein product [Periconia digitata]|uniref:Aminoglycoside phosphotransferase domain-containing protein n=1 Tax=Periconia digitata TaxID=1303443 RepID=A0A9W4UCC1_9PLEO|nr:unnamed protein product [Periconia digitata]
MDSSTSQPDLTTEAGMSAYLTARSISHTSITLLTGGNVNYVYRVTCPSETSSSSSTTSESIASQKERTFIYKHSEAYLHFSPTFAFDPARMDYENHVLIVVPELMDRYVPGKVCSVHSAKRYSYDAEKRVLCLEDGGERELKKAYADPLLNIPAIGTEMGRWIAALHMSTKKTSLSLTGAKDDVDLKANNPIGVEIYRYSYNNLSDAFAKYGHDVELANRVNEKFGSRLAADNECLCHGDYWPGNVLVKFRDERQEEVDLTVVDWEITRRGTSATDVGQFAAEAFLLDRFRGDRGILAAFLDAYLTERDFGAGAVEGVDEQEWITRMLVHWAVHIAFWPTRVEWTDREGTQDLVDMGRAVLISALDGDWAKLRNCQLLRSAGGRLADILA